jgi:hypothetical protein
VLSTGLTIQVVNPVKISIICSPARLLESTCTLTRAQHTRAHNGLQVRSQAAPVHTSDVFMGPFLINFPGCIAAIATLQKTADSKMEISCYCPANR